MKRLTAVTSGLSLILAFVPHPVFASVPCKSGTASSFSNGSIYTCILYQTMRMNTGVFSFDCQEAQSIKFDEQARLVACTLGSTFSIQQLGYTSICQSSKPIAIVYKDREQYISCNSH